MNKKFRDRTMKPTFIFTEHQTFSLKFQATWRKLHQTNQKRRINFLSVEYIQQYGNDKSAFKFQIKFGNSTMGYDTLSWTTTESYMKID